MIKCRLMDNDYMICSRQLVTIETGWPYDAAYCDLYERAAVNLEANIFCKDTEFQQKERLQYFIYSRIMW